MYAHLRTYTMNTGMMDAWIELFDAELVPRMRDAGIEVLGTWTNPERTQFIWVRAYGDDESDIETKEKAFYGSQWWQDNVDLVRSHLAHRDVRVIRSP